MAYTVVQKITATGTTSTGSATLGASPTQGNLLVAVVASAGNAAVGIATPSTWTIVAHGGGAYVGANILYKVAGASESATFSVTFSTTTQSWYSASIVVYELSTFTATPLDVAGSGTNLAAASTSWSSSTTATTTQADDLCIAAWSSAGAQTDTAYSNSFVKQDSVTEAVKSTNITTAFLETVAAGTQTCTMTRTASAANGQGCIATFKVGVLPFLAASPIIHSQAVNRSYTY